MLVPIILGSDKTTVSVGTGNNEYYPLYLSIGNVHNNVQRAHRGAVALIAFLAIPKSMSQYLVFVRGMSFHTKILALAADKEYTNDPKFRKFRRQLFHTSISRILETLKPGMTTPEIARCPDNHFRRIIYSLGAYIADYPEQAPLACIVQGWCPKCVLPDVLYFSHANQAFY